VYAQTLAAGGSVLGGSISAVTAAAFNPVDGRLYYVVSGFAPPKFGADLIFSMDLNPALSRAQREASVTLVGDFGPLTNGAPTVTGIAFDQVPTGVDLVGLYVDTTTPAPPLPPPGPGQPPVPGQRVNTQMFRVKLTDVRIRNPIPVFGSRDNTIPAGVFGGISIHRDTPDAQNDVIAVVSDDLNTEGVTDAAVVRIAADGTALLLGPMSDAAGASPTGVNPTGVAFNPTLTDPFTNTPGAYLGVDGASDELFFVDVRDRVLPVACCDPSAAYDDFGNLYYAYIAINSNQQTSTTVLVSTDNGQSFWQIADFQGVDQSASVGIDRCEITTARLADGTVTVWVSFDDFGLGSEMAAGMKVGGLGGPFGTTDIGTNGSFTTVESVPFSGQGNGNTSAANIAHLAIGPDGQVVYTWQTVSFLPSDKIYSNTDPDGLGPQPMGNAVFVDNTHVGFKEPLPSQPLRGISAVPTVSFDRSNGPHRGRVYMAYTHEVATDVIDPDTGLLLGQNSDSDILLRWSDDNGASWSGAVRVNDDPLNSDAAQFFQRVVVDQVTGNVGVGWLDSRDSQSNDNSADVGYYATVGQSTGTGILFAPNMRLNVGPSNARFSGNFGNDFGDYTALDFYNNVLWAAYPDNSNSTGDNPSGKLRAYDIYTARVRVTDTTEPIIPFVTPSSPLAPTVIKPQSLVKKGKFYQLKVQYSHPSGINLATVGNDDVVVTGPNGFSQPMQLLKAKAQKKTHSVQATYRLPAPGGKWDESENAVYTATLQAGSVTSTDGTTTTEAGTLTNFLVNVAPKKQGSKTSKQAPPPPAAVMAAAAAASPFGDAAILSGRKADDALALLA